MAIKDGLLPEYDHEMATTRRLLERVPDGDAAWKPHDKSMSLGELAAHIAHIPFWCTATIAAPVLDFDAMGDAARAPAFTSTGALIGDFDAKAAAARAALAACADAEMLAPWTLRAGGQEVFTLPRVAAIRSFVMNHLIHHRGQLSVYLRLRNVALPSIYGPTADEA
jgi:uncharacterized damage-inducible protein DinB